MDVNLVECAEGSKSAWDAFVERYSGIVFAAVQRTAGRHSGQPDRVDLLDCAQEVFVRLVKDDYRLLRSYDPARASISTWLTLVARSVTIDLLRKRRLETVPIESGDFTPRVSANARTLPQIPLQLLTPRQRLVLSMLYDQDMSVPEAARMIGVDAQTIRSTKHKAISRLREHLCVK